MASNDNRGSMSVKLQHLWNRRGRLFPNILGVAALFSGAALVFHILTGFSLRYGLMITAAMLVLAIVVGLLRIPASRRRLLLRIVGVGAFSGVLATASYDSTKAVLSQLDPSPYNPFELMHTFGVLLIGPTAPQPLIMLAGTSFHVLNGISFAIAFCFLFGRRGVIAGVLWGVFLETFQLTLYPGWLDIHFFKEFVAIGSLSHLVYGAVLGTCCRFGLERVDPRARATRTPVVPAQDNSMSKKPIA